MKSFFLDTNILLDNYENFFILSEQAKNKIILCDVVLDEIDSKKTLMDAVGYNAREFNRIMERSEIVEKSDLNGHAKRVIIQYNHEGNKAEIHFVQLNEFETPKNTDPKIINDRKIIETASKISGDYENFTVLSNDIAFRSRAIIGGMEVQPFRTENKKINELDLVGSYDLDDSLFDDCSDLSKQDYEAIIQKEIPETTCGLELNFSSGRKLYLYREGNSFHRIDEEAIKKQILNPINVRQKIISSMILSNTSDIYVLSGKSGSGKNSVVFSACCALLDEKQSPYEGITYIRNNIDSIDNKDQEFGFLPGDLNAKMDPYLRPMKDTIDKLVRVKYKQAIVRDKEKFEEKLEEFNEKYPIQFEAMNFLRGGTIENRLVILDEFQNSSISNLRLTLTRIGNNCKVFIMGDVAQIDNKYLNERNNALTFMLNQVGYQGEIQILGMHLTETIRSRIAGYAADHI